MALIVEAATDNRNRTVAEVRHILSKHGGSMGETGCVGWMFERKGVITLDGGKYTEDQVMEAALEAGADDVRDEGGTWEIHTAVADFAAVRDALEAVGMEMDSAELSMIPQNTVEVDADTGRKLMRLVDALEDNDDVQNVHANFDLPDEVLAELE